MNLLNTIINKIAKGNERSVAVKKNIIGSFFLKGISIIVSMLLVPATIGFVNAELYGVWLTLSSMMIWLGFADVGFTQGLKNKLTEAIAQNDWERGKALVSTTYVMMFVIFLPLCVILELIVPLVHWSSLLNINPIYEKDILQAMQVLVIFACTQMVANVIVSVVAAFQKVALSGSFLVIGNVLSLINVYLLRACCSPSLFSLVFAVSAMPILVTIIATLILYKGKFRRVAPSFRTVNTSYIKDLFCLGYKFFIINIQVLVLYQSTNILISYVSSPIEVTYYNIAYKLLNCAMMVYTIITAPLWPAYTDAYARNDFDWMKNMRDKMQIILLLSVMGCVLLAFCSQPIFSIWVGNSVRVPYTMIILVAIYVIVYCWMNLNGTLIVGMGKMQVDTYLVMIGMFLHIPLSLVLGQYWGAYGVLISLIIINILYAVVMNIQVTKLINRTANGIWNK